MTIVSTMPTAQKVFAALAIAAPLMLVACGSNEADSDSSSTAAAGSASAVTSTSAPEAAPEESAAGPEDGDNGTEDEEALASATPKSGKGTVVPTVPNAQGANAGAQQTLANPFEEGEQLEGVVQEPVAGGVPASQEDADAINGLVRGIYEQSTLNSLVQYVPNNTCEAVLAQSDLDPNHNTQGVPDMPLDQIPQFQQAQPSVDAVENLSVAGDRASADVTVTSGGQTDTSVMRFLREDGRWKFCSSAV
ncbi:Rv0361 family membrane protein [Corynebacterium guangdongense]|uniref:Secreted protein n=1 Tax=Corynebacterium guangdongense TaxID=1783348 RepID=A0ABU1ZZL4_9CORY|nr:hypothetical protein [Corynebacterium guangdongense]MDR7329697.1 hypothetical protein [Corynebacterium guangdongense]WJZ18261.1 hypothetical protein CGUA_08500 [Corynebacterium guangdongense]